MTWDDLLTKPGALLEFLAANDLLCACEPISADAFIDFCRKRGLRVDVERLEALERFGIFFPLVRIQYPQIKIKVERIDAIRVRHHGMLRDGQQWDGELLEQNSGLSWRSDWIKNWIDEGVAWDPRSRPFVRWKTFTRENHRARIESFYSIFQCFALRGILKRLTATVRLEQFGDTPEAEYHDRGDFHRVGRNLQRRGQDATRSLRKHQPGQGIAALAQILSARYYFHTQGDQRTITVPGDDIDGWDWWDFSRTWNAARIASQIGLTPEALARVHSHVDGSTTIDDPLEAWYDLTSFVALQKKEKLKGDALFAQLGYTIEHMLRLFYRDLSGKELLLPGESPDWTRAEKYGEQAAENPLRRLEFVANEYHLNPRPKAILVVEGEGEASEIPRVAKDVFGSDFRFAGIEVRPLGSVDEYTGDKRRDPYGALEKLIDDYHSRQTVVFIILDNENRAKTVSGKLLKARSRLVPGRMLTRDEYIHLWQRTFEFDNFTDDEIAAAMSKVAEDRYTFSGDEIRECRESWDKRPRDYLSILYRERLHYGLDKPSLASCLFDMLIENRKAELEHAAGKHRRPIFRLVRRLLRLAQENHQAESDEGQLRNQKTGYFGEFIGSD